MAERASPLTAVNATGLRVQLVHRMNVASLRYFESGGAFGRVISKALGVPLPGVIRAVNVPGFDNTPADILAWRSPTETMFLCAAESRFDALQALCLHEREGCFVDQTGGYRVVRATGERMPGLFSRLGGRALLPAPSESKRSRLGDVPVLALNVGSGETVLVVEQVYLEHFMDWMRQTAADLGVDATA